MLVIILTKCVKVMNRNNPPAKENTYLEYSIFPKHMPIINPIKAVHADRKLKHKARRTDIPD